MVDSKHDVITKPEKHDWTFFAFFAIALILIASAIVWAAAKAGLFGSNGLDDDTPQRLSLPAIPMPSSASTETSSSESVQPPSATEPDSPSATDNITPSAGAPVASNQADVAKPADVEKPADDAKDSK